MECKKIGAITSIAEIPLNEKVIITGNINSNSWVQRMGGIFEQNGNKILFKDDYGMSTEIDDKISVNLLRKI